MAGGTRLPFTIVDLEIVLEIAKRPVRPAMVPQGGAPGLNRIRQDRLDGLDKFVGALV
jgi:hypothetical protein